MNNKYLIQIAILVLIITMTIPLITIISKESSMMSFYNDIKMIYNTAKEQWTIDTIDGKRNITYINCDGDCKKQLNLDNMDIDYYITINDEGTVSEFYATNSKYQYNPSASLYPENTNEIKSKDNISEEDQIQVKCPDAENDIINVCRYSQNYDIVLFKCKKGDTVGTCLNTDEINFYTKDLYECMKPNGFVKSDFFGRYPYNFGVKAKSCYETSVTLVDTAQSDDQVRSSNEGCYAYTINKLPYYDEEK